MLARGEAHRLDDPGRRALEHRRGRLGGQVVGMLSRGVAGTRGRSLIVNFPGNPPAIEQAGAAIESALPHALALLAAAEPAEPGTARPDSSIRRA